MGKESRGQRRRKRTKADAAEADYREFMRGSFPTLAAVGYRGYQRHGRGAVVTPGHVALAIGRGDPDRRTALAYVPRKRFADAFAGDLGHLAVLVDGYDPEVAVVVAFADEDDSGWFIHDVFAIADGNGLTPPLAAARRFGGGATA